MEVQVLENGDVEFTIPPDCRPGQTMTFGIGDGKRLAVTLPEDSKPGSKCLIPKDEALASELAKGSFGKMSFVVPPELKPGDMIQLNDQDGDQIKYQLPRTCKPGDKIDLSVIKTEVPDGANAGDTMKVQGHEGPFDYQIPEGKKAGDPLHLVKNMAQEPRHFDVTKSRINFKIPAGAKPGDVFDVALANGDTIPVTIPPNGKPGMVIVLKNIQKNRVKNTLCVPAQAKGGDILHIPIDGKTIRYKLPPAAKAGDTIKVHPAEEVGCKVKVPEGLKAGDEFPVKLHGKTINVKVPEGLSEGASINIKLRLPLRLEMASSAAQPPLTPQQLKARQDKADEAMAALLLEEEAERSGKKKQGKAQSPKKAASQVRKEKQAQKKAAAAFGKQGMQAGFEIKIPEKLQAGDTFKLDVLKKPVEIKVPENMKGGDTLKIVLQGSVADEFQQRKLRADTAALLKKAQEDGDEEMTKEQAVEQLATDSGADFEPWYSVPVSDFNADDDEGFESAEEN